MEKENNTFTLEAKGEFPFTFYIEKAIPLEEEEQLILEGIASTTNIDHDDERMSKEALQAMANIINEKSVPLRVEHSKSENAIIGKVFKGWLDDRNQLHIRASLDKSHPVSPILHRSMKSDGKKMGFSVGGIVKRAAKEFSESVGRLVKTFYDVELKEVSVTPRPANYDSWAISKSIARDEEDAERSRGTALYDQFLFAHPQMDYMQVFAKSVPDDAWQRVESSDITKKSQNIFMEKNIAKKENEDSTGAETEKAVTRQEFNVLVKGIESLASAFSAFAEKSMDSAAMDANNPDKKKPEVIGGQATKKASDGAEDQNAPDKKKPKDIGEDATTKQREGQEDQGGNGSDEHGTREKTTKKEDTTDEYKLDTVERAITNLESMTKRLQGVKKMTDDEKDETKKAEDKDDETTKKADEEKEETSTTKGIHPLDQFVVTVTKTIEAMVDKMEKSGMNLVGFRKSMIDNIVNDPVMQEEIQKMMKVPGQKKSMSMGIPYVVSREGRRYQLTASEVGITTVEKSKSSEGKTFKDVYKKEFSSVRQEQE